MGWLWPVLVISQSVLICAGRSGPRSCPEFCMGATSTTLFWSTQPLPHLLPVPPLFHSTPTLPLHLCLFAPAGLCCYASAHRKASVFLLACLSSALPQSSQWNIALIHTHTETFHIYHMVNNPVSKGSKVVYTNLLPEYTKTDSPQDLPLSLNRDLIPAFPNSRPILSALPHRLFNMNRLRIKTNLKHSPRRVQCQSTSAWRRVVTAIWKVSHYDVVPSIKQGKNRYFPLFDSVAEDS